MPLFEVMLSRYLNKPRVVFQQMRDTYHLVIRFYRLHHVRVDRE